MTELLEMERIYTELGSIREDLATVKAQIARIADRELRADATDHPHILRSPHMHRSEPTIRGTSITVRTLVQRARLGETPDQIVEAYPGLGLAQVFDALGYYHDHPVEIESYIQENHVLSRPICQKRWSMLDLHH